MKTSSRKRPPHQDFWKHAPYSKKTKFPPLMSSLGNRSDNSMFSWLPNSISLKATTECNQYSMKGAERGGIGYIDKSKMCIKKSQPSKPGPMKCFFPFSSAFVVDAELPNTADTAVTRANGLEYNSPTEESQEHTAPLQCNTTVIPDYTDTITEETIFNKLDQTLLIDPSTYFYLPIDSNVSSVRLEPGVSFLAYCNNMDYHDTIIPVVIPKGYYLDSRGQFTLNEEICELNCTVCKQEIIDSSPQGVGFRNCSVQVKYRDTDRKSNCFSFEVDGDNFAFAKLSQPGHVRYFYVRFQVNAL